MSNPLITSQALAHQLHGNTQKNLDRFKYKQGFFGTTFSNAQVGVTRTISFNLPKHPLFTSCYFLGSTHPDDGTVDNNFAKLLDNVTVNIGFSGETISTAAVVIPPTSSAPAKLIIQIIFTAVTGSRKRTAWFHYFNFYDDADV